MTETSDEENRETKTGATESDANGETESAMFSIHINATKEAIWRELTKTDSAQDALWHTVLHSTGLKPGAAYQMRTPEGKYVNVVGEILEYDPPNRLKQTVRFIQFEGEPAATATYELDDAEEGGVTFTVHFDGLPKGSKTAKGVKGSGGVEFVCNTMKQIVEDGRASFSTRAMYWVARRTMFRMPNHTKTELWPLK